MKVPPIVRNYSTESNPQKLQANSKNFYRFERSENLQNVLPKSTQNDEDAVRFMQRARQGQIWNSLKKKVILVRDFPYQNLGESNLHATLGKNFFLEGRSRIPLAEEPTWIMPLLLTLLV